jgi:Sulfatase
MLRDQQATNPSKPWYMSFCPGANHAPHHSPREFADKYKGMFDEGYEAYRDWVLARMIAKGVLPAGTTLNPINPLPDDVAQPIDAMRPWDSLNDDEKRLLHGWPRCTPVSPNTPTPRSDGSSTISSRLASSTTRSSSIAPTTARPARVPRVVR